MRILLARFECPDAFWRISDYDKFLVCDPYIWRLFHHFIAQNFDLGLCFMILKLIPTQRSFALNVSWHPMVHSSKITSWRLFMDGVGGKYGLWILAFVQPPDFRCWMTIFCRICPGRFLANATIWATVASILSAFNVGKAKDAEGREIPVEGLYTDQGVVW